LKIRLSERSQEDYIAWFYEKSGLLSIRSAYQLAVNMDSGNQERTGSSARPLLNEVWTARVPTKVRIFEWRLSRDGLATQENRRRRTLESQVCGMEDKTGFHATVRCTKAAALRRELRKFWPLPKEAQFRDTGPDWLLHVLILA
jgi:hypothetical protein